MHRAMINWEAAAVPTCRATKSDLLLLLYSRVHRSHLVVVCCKSADKKMATELHANKFAGKTLTRGRRHRRSYRRGRLA